MCLTEKHSVGVCACVCVYRPGYHLVVEIRSVKGCSQCDCLWHAQDLLTVLEDATGCRGCEPEQWDFRELPLQDAQQFIICIQTHTNTSMHMLFSTLKINFDLKGGCIERTILPHSSILVKGASHLV